MDKALLSIISIRSISISIQQNAGKPVSATLGVFPVVMGRPRRTISQDALVASIGQGSILQAIVGREGFLLLFCVTLV